MTRTVPAGSLDTAVSPAPWINPVSKLAASVIIVATLVFSIDSVSASVALIGELLLLPFAGLRWRAFWRRTAVIWIAAVFAALTTSLYGRSSGQTYASFGLLSISDGSLELALATLLRILAIALPAVVLDMPPD